MLPFSTALLCPGHGPYSDAAYQLQRHIACTTCAFDSAMTCCLRVRLIATGRVLALQAHRNATSQRFAGFSPQKQGEGFGRVNPIRPFRHSLLPFRPPRCETGTPSFEYRNSCRSLSPGQFGSEPCARSLLTPNDIAADLIVNTGSHLPCIEVPNITLYLT